MPKVQLGRNILGANELLARKNQSLFDRNHILVLNIMSSPGAGKTTILERTIERLKDRIRIGVIEGDLYTDQDARRIEDKGVPVVQINTEGACHLDAGMVEKAVAELPLEQLDLVIIENVGNLVCPAEFNLGEHAQVVVSSIAEGNDKPLKYPLVFRQAKVILVNKIDLLPYTDFSLDRFIRDVGQINPDAQILMVSGRTGQGLEQWFEWLEEEVRKRP